MKSFKNFLTEKQNNTVDEYDNYVKLLNSMGINDIKKMSNSRLAILTDNNRVITLENLEKQLKISKIDAHYDKKPSSSSSVGILYVDKGKLAILAKPKSKQGKASAGVENELIIINTINNLTKSGPVNIRFDDGHKTFECIGVRSCTDAGRDTKNRKKADMILHGVHNYPISIKKDNYGVWESADRYEIEKTKAKLEKAINDKLCKIEFDTTKHVYKIVPNIAWKASNEQKKDIVFGSDILPNGCVIKKTFGGNLYTVDEDGWIVIKVSHIISKLSDIKGKDDVYFLIRNDSSRQNTKIGYSGIRVLAVNTARISSTVKVI